MPTARSGRRWRCGAGPTWSGRSGCCRASPTGSRSSSRRRSSRRRPIAGLFLIAPIITFTVALIAWAVIPFGRRHGARRHQCRPALPARDLARSASTASSSPAGRPTRNIPFYSALRAAAQMVSYEVSIGFVLIPVVLWAGTFNLSAIVEAQQRPRLRLAQRLRLQSAAVPDGGDLPDLGAWPRPRARRST